MKIRARATKIRARATKIRARATKIRARAMKIRARATKIRARATKIRARATKIRARATKIRARATKIRARATKIRARAMKIRARATKIRARATKIRARATKIRVANWYTVRAFPTTLRWSSTRDARLPISTMLRHRTSSNKSSQPRRLSGSRGSNASWPEPASWDMFVLRKQRDIVYDFYTITYQIHVEIQRLM